MDDQEPPVPPEVTGPPGSPQPPEVTGPPSSLQPPVPPEPPEPPPLQKQPQPPEQPEPLPPSPPPLAPPVADARAPSGPPLMPAAPTVPSGPPTLSAPPTPGEPPSMAGPPMTSAQPSAGELTTPSGRRRAGLIGVIVALVVLIAAGSATALLLTRPRGSSGGAATASSSPAQATPTPQPTSGTVSYTDPDAYYTAQFAHTPAYHATTQASPVGNVPYRYAEYVGAGVDQLVGVLVFSPGTGFDTRKGLDGIANAGHGTVIASAPSTFQGYPSLEGVISLQGDFLKVQIVHVGDLAYIIGTAGPVNPPSDYAGFIAGVHITPH